MKNYLDFEKEIKELELELDSLKSPFGSEGISEVTNVLLGHMVDHYARHLRLNRSYEALSVAD